MLRASLPSAALLLLSLSACDSGKGVTINANIDDDTASNSSVAIKNDGGNVSVNVPGFSANIKVPGGLFAHSEFDIDGVKLYPGATVTSMNVDAGPDEKKSGVKIAFAAPDSVDKVRSWFVKSFADKKVAIVPNGTGLAGKTADGDAVTMTFTPDGNRTKGLVDIVDAK